MRHQDTGEPRGFGFVTFAEHEDAKPAVASGFCTLGADQARCEVVFASPRPPPRGGPRGPMFPPRGPPGPGYGYGPPPGRSSLLRLRAASSPVTATLHRNRATRRPASASRRRASRATSSCRTGRRRGRLRATAVHLRRCAPPPAVPPAGRPGATTVPALPAARWARPASVSAAPTAASAAAPGPQYGAPPPELRRRSSAIRRCASSATIRCASGPTAVRRSAPGTARTARPRGGAPPQGQQYGAPPPAQQPSPYDGAPAYPAPRRRRAAATPGTVVLSSLRLLFRRSPRPIEIRYDETLRDERRPAEIDKPMRHRETDSPTRYCYRDPRDGEIASTRRAGETKRLPRRNRSRRASARSETRGVRFFIQVRFFIGGARATATGGRYVSTLHRPPPLSLAGGRAAKCS